MPTYFSSQFQQAYVTVPSEKISVGDSSGDVQVAQFNIAATAAVLSSADILKLVKLPQGSRILQVRLVVGALGAGTLNVGWSASANGLEAASASGVVSALAVTSATANVYYPNNARFAGEVDLQIIPVVSTSASGAISGYVLYSKA